jgi:hypothetical protein
MDAATIKSKFNNLSDALVKKCDKDDLSKIEERCKKYTDKTE